MLTKSLHTITAATNVARYLLTTAHCVRSDGHVVLASQALAILGYDLPPAAIDSTADRIVANCVKMIAAVRTAKKAA